MPHLTVWGWTGVVLAACAVLSGSAWGLYCFWKYEQEAEALYSGQYPWEGGD